MISCQYEFILVTWVASIIKSYSVRDVRAVLLVLDLFHNVLRLHSSAVHVYPFLKVGLAPLFFSLVDFFR